MRRWIFCLLFIGTVLALSDAPSAVRAATPVSDCRVTTEQENEATARLWFTEGYNAGNVDILDEMKSS